ncbi:MAG: bifunctional nicotinamide-nucleotide adenylyltransferase/Nudix hydroxylase [Cardiobacteriaceae bacterium]|nr:bifunctional nicotinamide-nucleotide adenylyltransferase/Nudix hydroxylase [Cardiobacteriaceae bacterium]
MQSHYDYLIYIGRFQPFHQGHLHMVRHALSQCNKLILLCGSADASRSTRNPWYVTERETMIRATLSHEENERLIFRPLYDDPYHDDAWTAQVEHTVAAVLTEEKQEQASIALFGHVKDASSFYLKFFPQWNFINVANIDGISATPIRRRYFLLPPAAPYNEAQLPPAVLDYLQQFRHTDAYQTVAEEMHYVADYQKSWANAPYPPIFTTVDALIICNAHILVVERGGQPGRGLLALPGGFLNPDEYLIDASLRELQEETGLCLTAEQLHSVRVADKPDRSAIGRVITHLHIFLLSVAILPEVRGTDDAAKAFWLPIDQLRRGQFHDDHYYLISDALKRLET